MLADRCPICQGPAPGRPARIAAFVVERCGMASGETSSRYCATCDFVFFERRLSPLEAAALYRGYRGNEYNEQRLRLEPSYAAYIPMFENPLGDYYRGRIADVAGVLDLFPEAIPDAVLDYGGDGTIAARLFPGAEISHLDSSAGAVLHRDQFPFVLASQVFEHLSDPVVELRQVAERLTADGLLLIDVPREYNAPLSEAVLWQAERGGSLMVMHEHINHFSARALRRLVEAAGLVPVFEAETTYLPLLLLIAGRPESTLARGLASASPARRLQWTLDRMRGWLMGSDARVLGTAFPPSANQS